MNCFEANRMLQAQRLALIKKMVDEHGFVSVSDLINKCNSSVSTIRRDLNMLGSNGEVVLTHGGAMTSRSTVSFEKPYLTKLESNPEEKERIAQTASKMVRPNQCIFLDSSTTVFGMLRYIKEIWPLCVITNDVRIAAEMSDCENIDTIVTGGELRKHFFTLKGMATYKWIEAFRFDVAFLGADFISATSGAMVTNFDEVAVKQLVIHNSANVFILADHTKFDLEGFARFATVSELTNIITGMETDTAIYDKLVSAGINVERV